MGKSKIIFGGEVLIDLTADTVSAATLAEGVTAHDKAGNVITGTNTNDVDSTDATAAEAEILNTKTAYARGAKLTGSMPNRGGVTGTISTKTGSYTIQQGYHDGSGKVSISSTEQAKIIASNIRSGVTILGVAGSLTTSSEKAQSSKTVTPSKTQQSVLPDSGYTCLQEVIVEAVPYSESANSAGGTTVTIL